MQSIVSHEGSVQVQILSEPSISAGYISNYIEDTVYLNRGGGIPSMPPHTPSAAEHLQAEF